MHCIYSREKWLSFTSVWYRLLIVLRIGKLRIWSFCYFFLQRSETTNNTTTSTSTDCSGSSCSTSDVDYHMYADVDEIKAKKVIVVACVGEHCCSFVLFTCTVNINSIRSTDSCYSCPLIINTQSYNYTANTPWYSLHTMSVIIIWHLVLLFMLNVNRMFYSMHEYIYCKNWLMINMYWATVYDS